jgi:hypothetical protein
MSWRSVGSGRYYQRSYRDADGRVRSQYIGRGPLAEAVASLDARERERRIEGRERTNALREGIAALEKPVVEYSDGVDQLFAAWMRLTGWHRHRGAWRRTGKITRRNMQTLEDISRAIAAEEVRREFEAGNVSELIERYRGDMAADAIEAIVSRITDDLARREALRRHAAKIRDELAGPAPTPIERILAQRVALCYLDAYHSDILAQSHFNIREGELCQRRQDRAQRRYLQAVKALAECRKLEASTIQNAVVRLGLVG